MIDQLKILEEKCQNLEELLKIEKQKAEYYKKLSEESGRRRVKENRRLSELVTDLRKQQEAYHDIEEQFQKVFETAHDGIFIKNIRCEYIAFNDSILKVLNLKRESALNKTDKENVTASQFETIQVSDKRVLKGAIEELEYELNINGVRKVFHVVKTPLRKENGEIYGILGIVRDITERKRIESNLENSLRFFRSIFNAIDDAVIVKDQKHRWIVANTAYCRLMEVQNIDVIGKTDHEIFDMKKAQHLYERDEEVFRNGATCESEENYVCTTGEAKKLSIKKSVFSVEDGTQYLIGVIRDITRQRVIEEQLQIRQKMDSLGTLASGIGHDFSNIFTILIGYINILYENNYGMSDIQKQCVEKAMNSAARAADLVEQFQKLSKEDFSEKKAVDVYDSAKEVFDILEIADKNMICKDLAISPGEFTVWANSSELSQVFVNLGTNAIEAISSAEDKKTSYMKISAEPYKLNRDSSGLKAGNYVHIIFEDNGPGMEEAVRTRAFDPLFTTKERGVKKGQGLGLAMVYNIITMKHKGTVEIETMPGEGTKIHMYLPVAEKRKKKSDSQKVISGSETLLIVDDEIEILNFLQYVLQRMGYKVYCASTGQRSLELFSKHKNEISVILLDLIMPEMNGQTVMEKILEISPDARIIIASAQSGEKINEKILSRSLGRVKKPFRIKELEKRIREAIDKT